jgi:FMN phosphatase YigB (HAD superfamily)
LDRARKRLGLPPSSRARRAYRRVNDVFWSRFRSGEIDLKTLARERFRRLLRELGEKPGLAPDLDRAYVEELSRSDELLPGCRWTLSRLARHFRLGVVTNGIERIQRGRLRAARLDGFFEVVVTSEACGFAKPDPRILGVALAALDLRPREAFYVGDDLGADGGAARAARVPFCWLDHGSAPPRGVRPPRRRVTRLSQLPALLRGT